jgi:hypothetical protein
MGRAKRVKAGRWTPRQAPHRAGIRPHDREVAEPAAARAARRDYWISKLFAHSPTRPQWTRVVYGVS